MKGKRGRQPPCSCPVLQLPGWRSDGQGQLHVPCIAALPGSEQFPTLHCGPAGQWAFSHLALRPCGAMGISPPRDWRKTLHLPWDPVMQNAGCKALEKAGEVSCGSAGNNLALTNDQAPIAPNAHLACVLPWLPGAPIRASREETPPGLRPQRPGSGFESWSGGHRQGEGGLPGAGQGLGRSSVTHGAEGEG